MSIHSNHYLQLYAKKTHTHTPLCVVEQSSEQSPGNSTITGREDLRLPFFHIHVGSNQDQSKSASGSQ